MQKIKILPVKCMIIQSNTSEGFIGTVNLYTGEVKFKQNIWVRADLTIRFDFDDIEYNYPIQCLGGRYLVHNYKEEPLFKSFFLASKLNKNLESHNIVVSKKIKI